jgi:DNA repair protein RadA/Sms
MGRCPECGEFGTLEKLEIREEREKRESPRLAPLKQVEISKDERFSTGGEEMDRVLGGGVVRGAVILLGGEPGIGKSTLLLQVASKLCERGNVLYVSGEESPSQIKLRASRLSINEERLLLLAETDVESIAESILSLKPEAVIIDSIQTIYHPEIESPPGTVSQVRECAFRLINLVKPLGIPLFLVGHITKEGTLAGPKTLEHMVDCVLYLEGDGVHPWRILRATKNRFGSTNEVAMFEMREEGMIEVKNPSLELLAERDKHAVGSVVTAIMEGSRPLLHEVQALVTYSPFPQPRRMVQGVDYNRFVIMVAVLEKKLGLKLYQQDVIVNVVGGIRIEEPAADLAMAMAILSSAKSQPLPPDLLIFGEVGLGGEVRSVPWAQSRLEEAERLGFSKALIPKHNLKKISPPPSLKIVGVSNLKEAVGILQGGEEW